MPFGSLNRDDFDAVLFDVGGVLLLPDPSASRAALRAFECQATDDDWHRSYYLGNHEMEPMSGPDWTVVRRAVAACVGIPPDRVEEAVPIIERLFASMPWVAADDAAATLEALATAGYQLGIISNGFGTVEQNLMDLELCSVEGVGMTKVEVIVDSHLVGVSKPDPAIFHLALEALGVAPFRSIYVGDTVRFDVQGAFAVGIHPIHLDPYHLCSGDHDHISSLRELV
jgi:putative hydrolase of the HAD superfamily